jgi:hypothetical protein
VPTPSVTNRTNAWISTTSPARINDTPELVCELGGVGHGTDVTAGQVDDVAAELSPQHHIYLAGGVTTRFPADGQQDPVDMGSKGIEGELDCRVLT